MTEVTRHFTATTFIVRGNQVLLHRHPKQGLWLPPGGHIERDELPHQAAVREILEETGLALRLHSEAQAVDMSRQMECAVVPQPAFILIEDINPFHQHIDFTYFATIPDDVPACQGENAVSSRNGFAWFEHQELGMQDVPRNVKEGSRLAIDYFSNGDDSRT